MNSSAFSLRAGLLLVCFVAGLPAAEQNPPPPLADQPAAALEPPIIAAPTRPELELTARFDRNGDHRLDAAERQAAREFLARQPLPAPAASAGRPGQITRLDGPLEPVRTGMRVSPDQAGKFGDQPLYDAHILRTLFLDFENDGWERELSDFERTDVLVSAQLRLDGHNYPGVGVHLLSRPAIEPLGPGYKRSLDLRLDHTVSGQKLAGQHELRLLDARTDPTFLRTMLYSRIAREYLPAPEANFIRLVINGEYRGIFVSVQPFDENFVRQHFRSDKGAWWTVFPGGNLDYLGDNPEAYRRCYRLETGEDPAAWAALIRLCQLLKQTEPGELEEALTPHLDLAGTLKFLALENALINQDGYGSPTGTFGLYLDQAGRFHLVPQESEASFRLLQASEYGERRPARNNRVRTTGNKGGESAETVPPGYNPKDFPHQTGTDLAMILSYSFISKADNALDGKITREEWRDFARAWFMAMDEDFTGQLTRDQFMTKFRLQVAPTSITDGKTRQTFGQDDPAGVIGQDFFAALDGNHDDQLTPDEMVLTLDRWFTDWSDPKTGRLTQNRLQVGFNTLFSRSVFRADQAYIARKNELPPSGDGATEGRRRGGNGLGIGPLRLPWLGGRGRNADRGLIVFHQELDPLGGLGEPGKPLLTKLLTEPGLRARYLKAEEDITTNWLDWEKLGPIAKEWHTLIIAAVEADTHKPDSYEHFVQELDQDTTPGAREGDAVPSLRNFVIERRSYLLKTGLLPEGE